MRPATRELIGEVAARYGVEPAEILAHVKPRRLLGARIEIAKALAERGYNSPQIGRVMNRDHTTVSYWLGRLSSKQPKLREPKPLKPSRRKVREEPTRLVRYAGFDPTEAHRE